MLLSHLSSMVIYGRSIAICAVLALRIVVYVQAFAGIPSAHPAALGRCLSICPRPGLVANAARRRRASSFSFSSSFTSSVSSPLLHTTTMIPRLMSTTALHSSEEDQSSSSDDELPYFMRPAMAMEPSEDDANKLARLLRDLRQCFANSQEENALTLISNHLGWLFSRNIPVLMEMVTQMEPDSRTDEDTILAYSFLMDFLEITAKETKKMLESNQVVLKRILEAAKISNGTLERLFEEDWPKISSSNFMVYLDSEIDMQTVNTPSHDILYTIKLKILDRIGQSKGDDIHAIARIVNEPTDVLVRSKTIDHLESYHQSERELFLQALRLMIADMRKNYMGVDPVLIAKLEIIESAAVEMLPPDAVDSR